MRLALDDAAYASAQSATPPTWPLGPDLMLSPGQTETVYAVLPDAFVEPALGRAVRGAVAAATAELGLGSVRVQWIMDAAGVKGDARRVTAPAGVAAFVEPATYPGELFIRLCAPYPVRTALHECRHLWQWAAGWYTARRLLVSVDAPAGCRHCRELERMEGDAARWAAQWLPRLGLAEYRGERACRRV